ncbi:DUF4203 domain-containing protein [Pseudactinotalea terrae]|uniref:TM7S3/TM198-like domain-containing protein n=1 Tax=Pseudactinotalea terrae TaxID=1743262 RepID=UPI0012E318BF|nr:DUF4203 domain-containing protein [Pseudactinotalea terrae]
MGGELVVGIIAVLIGLIVCLRGYVALRIIISLLGAWMGFIFGGALVASVTGEGFLATTFTWVGAIVGALLLGLLAYAFYQVAVLLGMGALGFTIATAVLAALGVDNRALIWIVAGAAALLAIVLAIVTDLPAGILIVLTALAGANIAVTGLLVLLGQLDVADLEAGYVPDGGVPLWAGIVALVLAILGIVVQWRGVARDKRMRAAWAA